MTYSDELTDEPTALERWMAERRENQFVGRCIISGLALLIYLGLVAIVVVDHWHHIGAMIDGVIVLTLALVVVLAIIWMIPDWS